MGDNLMYYSQTLSICHIDNTCVKCEKTFEKWSDYHSHVMTVNCLNRPQLPVVSSKRNLVGVKNPWSNERHRLIIQAFENKHKGAIIQ